MTRAAAAALSQFSTTVQRHLWRTSAASNMWHITECSCPATQDEGQRGSRSLVSGWFQRWDLLATRLQMARQAKQRKREERLLNGFS